MVCGANATLNVETLQFSGAPAFGAYPSAKGDVFFRLWDGTAPITSFPISSTQPARERHLPAIRRRDARGVSRARLLGIRASPAAGVSYFPTTVSRPQSRRQSPNFPFPGLYVQSLPDPLEWCGDPASPRYGHSAQSRQGPQVSC